MSSSSVATDATESDQAVRSFQHSKRALPPVVMDMIVEMYVLENWKRHYVFPSEKWKQATSVIPLLQSSKQISQLVIKYLYRNPEFTARSQLTRFLTVSQPSSYYHLRSISASPTVLCTREWNDRTAEKFKKRVMKYLKREAAGRGAEGSEGDVKLVRKPISVDIQGRRLLSGTILHLLNVETLTWHNPVDLTPTDQKFLREDIKHLHVRSSAGLYNFKSSNLETVHLDLDSASAVNQLVAIAESSPSLKAVYMKPPTSIPHLFCKIKNEDLRLKCFMLRRLCKRGCKKKAPEEPPDLDQASDLGRQILEARRLWQCEMMRSSIMRALLKPAANKTTNPV